MPSSYSSSLRLELQASGENANTWGTKTNNNLNLIEQAISGYTKITLASASATYNLTIADASASEGRNAFIEFAGTVASAISIVVPDAEKGYWVRNSATGSPLTFRTSSGTGLTLPTNEWVFLIADGTSVVSTLPTSLTNYARLAAANTFTNANTFTSAVTLQGPVSVVGATTFTSAVTFSGATSLASTLAVNGTATFNGVVSVGGLLNADYVRAAVVSLAGSFLVGVPALTVTGGVRIKVSGAPDLTNFSVSGAASFSGATTFSSTVNMRSNVSIVGNVIVSGAATFASATSILALTVTNNATLNGNVSVSGSFTVSGAATLASAVTMRGPVSLASTFNVSGVATFGRTIFVSATAAAPYFQGFAGGVTHSLLSGGMLTLAEYGVASRYSTLTNSDLALGVNSSANAGFVGIFLTVSGTNSDASIIRYSSAVDSRDDLEIYTDKKIYLNAPRIDLGGRTLFPSYVSAPAAPVAGEVYYDASTNKLRCYNGTTWNDLF